MALFSIKKKKKVATKAVVKPKVTAVKVKLKKVVVVKKTVAKKVPATPKVSKQTRSFISKFSDAIMNAMFTKSGTVRKEAKDFVKAYKK